MTHLANLPSVVVVERDDECRNAMAEGLRSDGMKVSAFTASSEALMSLAAGERPAVVVITPQGDGSLDGELARAVKALSPQAAIVFTQSPAGAALPTGFHLLAKPFSPSKLSRFIRLVVARPALRSTLQALYRRAHSTAALA